MNSVHETFCSEETLYCSYIIPSSPIFNFENWKKNCDQQISKLDWFLKDRGTLKTEEMMLKMQLCITGINYILNYYTIENSFSILFKNVKVQIVKIFHNITVFESILR